MKLLKSRVVVVGILVFASLLVSQVVFAQIKIGYIDSQKILVSFKDAQDVQKQLDAKNQEWQKQGQDMQQQAINLRDQLESQSLLLSQEKKAEKEREIQDLIMKLQQFQQEKWGQGGEAFKLQNDLLKPVMDKINAVLEKIGKDEKFDYIFDAVAGNIVYANSDQPDLTDRVLEELNKGVAQQSTPKK